MSRISDPCPLPNGTRIRLIKMGDDDPCPMEPGEEGTVFGGHGEQIWVRWDSGRGLILLPGIDKYEVIK